MAKKLNVAVIFGGRSGEHEVSLVSAESLMKNLDRKKYSIVQVGITKGGEWIVGADSLKFLKTGNGEQFKQEALSPDTFKNSLAGKKIDVAIPILHGTYGEDGTLQGLLELADLPYVGCGVLASAVAMDKITQKTLCAAENILIADWIWLAKKEWQWTKKNKAVFKRWLSGVDKRLGYPVFVKPSNLGSSVGISKARDRDELIKAINLAAGYDRRILVEKSIQGALEIEVSVLGNGAPEASLPGQIVASNEFYDYDAKYVDGKSESIIPAPLPRKVLRQIQDIAVQAFKLLDGAGMARADFLVKKSGKNYKIYFSELNTIPGFTSISMYPKLWEKSGVPYGRLLDILIKLAVERHGEKKQLSRSFKTGDWYR